MKSRISIGLTILVAVGIAMTQLGAGSQDKLDKSAIAKKQFEQMKMLVGNWEGMAMQGEEGSPGVVTYRLTASGSVILETMNGGTPGEMITMYHLDGENLMLTHYCAVRNQPRMKAKHSVNTKSIDFAYFDGTNMDPKKDMYMHGVKFNFADDGSVETTWTMYSGGVEQNQMKIQMHRVKK